MSFQNENFGMMDEGYFVPRGQILSWLNDLLKLNLTKIEQLGSGAVYCQIVDVIHPGSISMNKVSWKAKNDYEFISNMKILQNAFAKVGIKRYVDVEKLSKAKYQDNLEFIQWMKRYYDKNCGDRGNNYNAEERRGGVAIDFGFSDKNVVAKTYNGSGVVIAPTKAILEKPKKQTTKQQIEPNKLKPTKNNQEKTKSNTNIKTKPNLSSTKDADLKRLKDLQIKMSMIAEIIESNDSDDLKVKLISEIIKPSSNEEQSQIKKQEFQNVEEQVDQTMI